MCYRALMSNILVFCVVYIITTCTVSSRDELFPKTIVLLLTDFVSVRQRDYFPTS